MKYLKRIVAGLLVAGTISGFSAQNVYALEDKKALLGNLTNELETVSVLRQESETQLEMNLKEIEKLNRDREIYRIRAEYLRSNIEETMKKGEMLDEKNPNIIQAALLTLTNGYLEMELADILIAIHSSAEEFEQYQEKEIRKDDKEAIREGLQEKLSKLEEDLAQVEEILSNGASRSTELLTFNGELSVKITEVETQSETLSAQKTKVEEEIRVEEEKRKQQELERKRATTFIRPASGRLTSGYGNRIHPVTRRRAFHAGIDIANSRGTSILASRNGKVTFAGYKGTYGKLIIVNHGNGIETAYAHLSSINVKVGQSVTQGNVIGKMGSTGRSTGSHLHFEIRMGGSTVNPSKYIK
ncbi:peptidoglycan DD-metalloendopeptidase family protein [Proteiniclasticum sp. C24MP]|uniref:peptidoglycan DD-metalloendopeptidase family protein n=1 Tax=Proteiniclasticum sp. C24MP TaxID=3374101 RepID=UPI003754E3B4